MKPRSRVTVVNMVQKSGPLLLAPGPCSTLVITSKIHVAMLQRCQEELFALEPNPEIKFKAQDLEKLLYLVGVLKYELRRASLTF